MHVLELPKLHAKPLVETSELEKWLLFMKGDKKTKEALALDSSTLNEALSEIERLSQNPETVRLAISREIHLRDQLQREEDAKLEGREEGAELRDREIDLLNMHAANVPIELIARFTQVPVEKVEEIIESVD